MKNVYVIVPAGGTGTRFGAKKQFAEIQGMPLIVRTVEGILDAFRHIDPKKYALKRIVIAAPSADCSQMEALFSAHASIVKITAGGESRAESVGKAFRVLKDDSVNGSSACTRTERIDDRESYVAVHDGCRPFASASLWRVLLEGLSGDADFVLPFTDITDTLKAKDSLLNIAREDYVTVQTPQMMRMGAARVLYDASDYGASVTDDATLAKNYGCSIRLIRGEKCNIKITDPEDMVLAQALLQIQ
ncbi:MAG: 2-C-methyl-D-erythritol 4-phosphate cytidylyltransferase [Bacillota bacterium]|nr:2-C-methyl-D-erythritol 4-phosphate cytidylyltransferase [Bacillota bacterium]